MTYRKDIDGLRAIAILPVLLFHAGFDLFQGGFVGVDIFFVISGYLITALILRDKEAGSFSLVQFYERRARRILPALFFVMLCCLPFAWRWLLPNELDDFSDSVIAAILFVSNIHFFRETGYFAPDADHQPLLHTWSLSIEEQFYLLFPLLVMACWVLGHKVLFRLVAALALCSLLAAEFSDVLVPADNAQAPGRNSAASDFGFFLLPTRAWELLAGAMAAFHLHGRKDGPYGSQILSFAGLIAIVFAIFTFDDATPHPGIQTLIPVVGTVLIILCARPETACARLLSTPILVGIGLISYSVYLWHQPLFAFFRLRSLEPPSDIALLLLALSSLGLGWLSWRYVEQPFRDQKKVSRQQIFKGSALGAAVLLGLGLIGNAYDGFLNRFPPNERDLILAADLDKMGRYIYSRYDQVKDQPFDPNAHLKVIVIGDSYGQDLVNMLAEAGELKRISLSIHEISSHCGNLYLTSDFKGHIKAEHLPYCTKKGWYEDEGLQQRLHQADVVFLASSWSSWTAKLLAESVSNLRAGFDAEVLVIGKKYFGNIKPLHYIGMDDQEKRSITNMINGEHLEVNQMMADNLDSDSFVDLIELFCGHGNTCPIFTPESKLISYDGGHLTEAGAVYLGRKLITHPLIRDALDLDPPYLARQQDRR